MATLSTSLRKVAHDLLAAHGAPVTYRVLALGAYDIVDGAAVDTPTDTAIKGVWQPYTAFELANGIRAGDRRLILAAMDVPREPPQADQDSILVGTLELSILDFETTDAQGQAVLYALHLRGPAA